MSTPRPAYEIQTGQFIVSSEARRDSKGRIAVYQLPKADGGGSYEVAGINDRYHPAKASELRHLIQAGKYAEAEAAAVEYILDYTDVVFGWHPHPAIQAFLRDSAFNRGPGGAAKIYQLAIGGVKVDGKVGPITRTSAEALTQQIQPSGLLVKLLDARERYERQIAPPIGARAKFWQGLKNRWKKAFDFAWGML